MSTNYFGLSIPKTKEWEERKAKSIEEAGEMKGLIPIIEEYYEKYKPKEIHIGKSSMGWDFLFNYNGGKYYTNKLELLNWLETLNIYDEYGKSITAGELWHIVTNYKGRTHRSETQYASMYLLIDGLEFLDSEFS